MVNDILHVFKESLMITGFVFVMMLVIEYINVQTNGIWQKNITGNRWKQYLLAGLLGAIPGCLGAFTSVALFSHRLISFGAIVATMIATSGDAAFVMFAMFPQKAVLLTVILFGIGIFAGYITDAIPFSKKFMNKFAEKEFPLHIEEHCDCFQKDKLLHYILKPSKFRIILIVVLISLFIAFITGVLAAHAETWIRITLLIVVAFSLFVVITVPEHFLKEHLWEHIVKIHLLRIFLWTFGALLALHFLTNFIDVESWMSENMLIVLLVAVTVGIIPESGPHLIFVTLFAQGSIPFSILLASSIAQDGHGMLPLLAESKRGFIAVKFVNIIFALIAGLIGYFLNF